MAFIRLALEKAKDVGSRHLAVRVRPKGGITSGGGRFDPEAARFRREPLTLKGARHEAPPMTRPTPSTRDARAGLKGVALVVQSTLFIDLMRGQS